MSRDEAQQAGCACPSPHAFECVEVRYGLEKAYEGCECPCHAADDDDGWWDTDWEDVDDDRAWCTRCGGDGWTECPDSFECTRPHNALDECECGACGGSGKAADQTVW